MKKNMKDAKRKTLFSSNRCKRFYKNVCNRKSWNIFILCCKYYEINTNTPYEDPIVQANICVEFCTPTLALQSYEKEAPAIGICVLGNINQSEVSIEELPYYTKMLVEMQTMLALRQNHPTSQANSFVRNYRDIGIGFSNHANWLAKQGLRYGTQEAIDAHDRWMEHFSYGLISASCDLVDTFGKAPLFHKTNWSTKMPIDRYKNCRYYL